MLRLYHPGTGQAAPVRPARRGELSTYTLGLAGGEPVQARELRCYLLSDLIRRVAERHHLQVNAWHSGSRTAGPGALHRACGALNIYPAEFSARSPEPLDIGISPPGSPAPPREPGAHWVCAGHVLFADDPAAPSPAAPSPAAPSPAAPSPAAPSLAVSSPASVGVADVVARGMDPLALRLALLAEHYRQPAELNWDILAAADEWLRRWREQVAGWARSPSKPMSAPHVAEVSAAFDDDLATPAALRTLQALAADGEVPPGAKFEAFAYLDRLLGLDLAREVGR